MGHYSQSKPCLIKSRKLARSSSGRVRPPRRASSPQARSPSVPRGSSSPQRLRHPPSRSPSPDLSHPTSPPPAANDQQQEAATPSPTSPPPPTAFSRPRVWIEEVPDEGDAVPSDPVRVVDYHPTAGEEYRKTYQTEWEKRRDADLKAKKEAYEPFTSLHDWDLARFLAQSGMSQEKIDEFLKLPIVSYLCEHLLTVLLTRISSRLKSGPSRPSRTSTSSTRRSTPSLSAQNSAAKPLRLPAIFSTNVERT